MPDLARPAGYYTELARGAPSLAALSEALEEDFPVGLSGESAQELKALFARACPDLAWRVRNPPAKPGSSPASFMSPCTDTTDS